MKIKSQHRDPTYYALRLGFGKEGHGDCIFVCAATTREDCEQAAHQILEADPPPGWAESGRSLWIGQRGWLLRNFPKQKGRTSTAEAIAKAFGYR